MGSHAQPLAILGLMLAFAFLHVTVSHAAVTPCPAVPGSHTPSNPTTDTDPMVTEIRELRREVAVTCDAIRGAGVETRDAVTETRDAVAASDSRSTVTASAADIIEAIEAIPPPADAGTESQPAVVSLANSDQIQSEVIKGYNATREAIWILAGFMVAMIVAPMLRRVIFP